MAISPEKLMRTFENPKLSDKDKKLADKIENTIDNDIVRSYGNEYNSSNDSIVDGFTCRVFLASHLRSNNFDSIQYVKAYLLNTYRNVGWDINLKDNWTSWGMKFNKARLREENIDKILNDEEEEMED